MGEGQSKEAGNGSGSGSGSNSGSSPSSGPKALPDSSKAISPLRLRKGSSSSPSKKRNEIGSSATVPGAKKKEKEKEKGKKIKTHKEDKPHKESRFSSHRRRKSLAAPETNDNTSPSHNFSSSGYYNKFGPSSSAEQISKRREGILAQSKKQISDLEDQVAGSTEKDIPIKEKESPKEEEKQTPRGSKKASKKQVKSDSEADPSSSSSSSSSHAKSKSKSPSVSLGSAVTKKHNKREPVGAYLEKKPVEVQGGSYLTKKPKDCSSSGDDSDSDSDDDVDWSNLDSDSDLSEEEDTDSDCEKKSKKPQKKEMSFLELISNIRTFSVDELMDVGKDLAEKNPSFVEDLREAVQDVLDMKRAIDSEDENDSDHETDVSSPNYHQVPETVPKSIALEHLEIHKGSACDWNARFQAAIEDLKEHGEVSFERMRIYSQLSNLAQDFIHCAKNYGRIIISEAETPFALKTIKPCNMGGFAGGEKYLVNNIMFKFAVDSRGFFDDSESAIKVAGHDLKGLVRYFNLGISGVHFPLMALVDYLGYRLTALSFLPINDNTLVYGSSDAGATVHASNETFNQKMMLAASLLNLKPHVIGNSKQTLWSAADIEGHEVDSKFYLVDFSRAFPPCKYDTTVRNSFMFRQFRPEFVKAYQKPLCPDAYTGFESAKDAPEHAKEIEVATRYLTSKVITSYAHTINRLPPKELDELQLKESIHEAGINIRYLGFVRQYVTVEVIKHRILVEMVARVIKHIIRAKMREVMQRLKLPLEHSCRELVIDYLNLIFGSSPDSEVHWDKVIRSALLRNFPAALSDQETCYPLRRMLTPNDLCELFKMVCDMSHLVFSERAKHEFSTNPAVFTFEIPFDITDLEEIGVKVRDMNIVALAQGYVLKSKARAKQGRNSQRLCSLAIEKFRIALSDNLGDKRTLIELADATNILGDLALSDFYFKRAIACDMKDPNTLFKYAVFLEESMKKMDEAEEYYLRTLEHDPFHDHCLQRYGHFLDSRGLSDQAEEFYLRAADVRKARSQRLATRSSSNTHSPVVLSSPSVSVSVSVSVSSSSSAAGHHSD